MRKVTEEMVKAFSKNKNYKNKNTVVSVGEEETAVLLHGNMIAYREHKTGNVYISNRGYDTTVTKERLNAIIASEIGSANGYIFQRNFQWFWGTGKNVTPFPYNRFVKL
jgi:uracil-DNA glycosylase